MATKHDIRRYRENWQNEVDSASQYRAMALGEKQDNVAAVYRRLADVEDKHAAFWEEKLRAAHHPAGPRKPSWRARTLSWIARKWGAEYILPTIASQEYASRNEYLEHPETEGTRMTHDERMHARLLGGLLRDGAGARGRRPRGVEGSLLGQLESQHRSIGGNALRAAVLGANDGLCSNLSLVVGVIGATFDHRVVLLTGMAGLLAGAFSMALGEWISVTSARELAERELRIERSELEENPEEEREELQLIYEAKGLTPKDAKELSTKLMKDPKTALDALSREELGIDPKETFGSPWVAALTSLFLFAVGAIIPVFPFFFVGSRSAIVFSLVAGGFGLFGIGALITLFTGRSVLFSGTRQLVLGFAAAAVTFAIGRAIGVALAG